MKKFTLILLLLAALLAFSSPALSSTVFELGTVYTAGVTGLTPTGTAPWLRAVFTDAATPGTVQLTMTSLLQDPSEFVSNWYFNVDGSALTSGSFAYVSGLQATSITIGTNSIAAPGDGNFDFKFEWNANLFNNNDSVIYYITASGLDASDFDKVSAPKGGALSGLDTAAHVQGIPLPGGGTSSVHITTPIPAAAWLLGTGLVGLVVIRRKYK